MELISYNDKELTVLVQYPVKVHKIVLDLETSAFAVYRSKKMIAVNEHDSDMVSSMKYWACQRVNYSERPSLKKLYEKLEEITIKINQYDL